MALLTIRSTKRYAVRHPVHLAKDGAEELTGLLIELCSEGCRISGLGACELNEGEEVCIKLGARRLEGFVRWARNGVAGVRFAQALFERQIGELIGDDRQNRRLRVN
jgi:hypothetical protein